MLLEGNPIYENPAGQGPDCLHPDELYYFLSASTRDMMRFFKGFYPRFDGARYEALKDVFTTINEKQPIRRLSKGMQKQPPSGWPCAAGPTCWCWTSRWTAWIR